MASDAVPVPFRLDVRFTDPVRRALMACAAPALERALALSALNRVYAGTRGDAAGPFSVRALRELLVSVDVPRADLARIPASGPLLVVANHPFGGLDGLALDAVLSRVRRDMKLVGNHLLHRIPELRETVLPVDPFGGPEAARASLAGLRAAVRWLRAGGCLGVFPAGEVSHLDLSRSAIADPAWSDSVARLARQPGVVVLPVFFSGANSTAFQVAGLLHPRLRTLLLPRELLRRRASTVSLRIGRPLTPDRLAAFADEAALTGWLRACTYRLADPGPSRRSWRARLPRLAAVRVPVAGPMPGALVAQDFEALPATQWLCSQGPWRVAIATAPQLPRALAEIGRLRELTFRAAGEGPGRARDLDAFDARYLHLCVWHAEAREIVGAYRLGLTDAIARDGDTGSLYTSTLFRYDAQLLARIGPAIELGRSFVRAEYQRDYAPLLLLWKGIGRFVAQHPGYRHLFGPVSISGEYAPASRDLLRAFLETSCASPLAGLVTPRQPAKERSALPCGLRQPLAADLDAVDALIVNLEGEGRGVPVLLRQYLRLGARALGFAVDPAFGHTLDALMLVDLACVPPPVLARYMGRASAEAFLAGHRAAPGHGVQCAGADVCRPAG